MAYDTLSGVSFVGSFKIIEQELLPRFKQIKLILGMEDQKTGQNLNQFLIGLKYWLIRKDQNDKTNRG